MNGADADVTYVLNGATRGFTAEDVTLTDDDIQISGEYLIVGVGTAANQPPTITSGGTAIAAENQVTTSYTPAATDPENDSMSFSIIGGADADLFELDGCQWCAEVQGRRQTSRPRAPQTTTTSTRCRSEPVMATAEPIRRPSTSRWTDERRRS